MLASVGNIAGKAALQALKVGASAAFGVPFATSGATAVATPNALGPINVSAPAANGYIRRTGTASMRSTGRGNMVITHREYLQDIVPATETNENVFQLLVSENINPGNTQMFPWLASIATRFETYVFRALRFIYEPQCSTNSVGTMSQVIDYDALDDPPQTKLQMMAYKGAVRSPPWFCSEFNASPQDLHKMKEYYVRNSAQQHGGDARVYDVGNFYLAYEGPADDGGAAGELYVEYTVELKTPNLQPYVLSGQSNNLGSVGNYITPSTPQAVTTSGPLTVSVVGNATANGFYVGASAPGTYLMVYTADQNSSALGGDNFLSASVPTGSNAQIDGDLLYDTVVAAGDSGQMTTWVPVFFPTTDDIVLITLGQSWSSSQILQLRVQLLPLSQEQFGFPSTNNPSVLPLAMRRGMQKVLTAGTALERRSKREAEIVAACDVYRKSRAVECADCPVPGQRRNQRNRKPA